MHRQEIVARLNRAAAEVDGWSDIQFSFLMSEWVGWPPDIQGFKNPIPDYCSENVSHARLVGLLRKVKEAKRGQEWGKFLSKCVWPKADNNSPFWHTEVLDCVAATPLFIVAACLAALDKLPADITLDMIRGVEAGETCNEDRDAPTGEEE